MTEINKMQWFIEMYNNNNLSYIIHSSKQLFGTVVMPTGTGKSGVVYEDIVKIIDNNPKRHKVIINISCPILKLTQQFINDFFAICKILYTEKEKTFSFFINSSDNGKHYNDVISNMDIDIEYFKDIERKFINNPDSDIAIVASCHKSLHKFIKEANKLYNSNIEIVSYIDEAHLLDVHKDNKDEDVVYVDIDSLCKFSSKVYALTATPDPEVTEAINKWNVVNSKKYLHHIRPIEAINDNKILPPLVKYIQTETKGITSGMLISILKDAQHDNPNIKHKILVTAASTEQLKNLRVELEKEGYVVFSTCSYYGYDLDPDNNDNEEYKDVVDFTNAVDNYDGDCFVLHVRQLIQGIDIKSLTDCVLWSADNGSQEHYRHTIQTIGRILRPLAGERGVTKENRKKKVGRVYFISPVDNDKVQHNISNFICRYYGFDNVEFEMKCYKNSQNANNSNDLFDNFQLHNFKSGWDNVAIKELLINIEKYITEKIEPKIKLYNKLSKKIDINAEAKEILLKYDIFDAEWNTSDLLDNKDLLDKIRELFKKHQIDSALF